MKSYANGLDVNKRLRTLPSPSLSCDPQMLLRSCNRARSLRSTSSSSRAMSSTPSTRQRPANWKARAPASPAGTTFAAQPDLPHLPVPELPHTIARLKESLKPIAWSDAEYATAVKKIDQFASGPLAPKLQERLVKRASEKEHWLEEWWDDAGYLGYRDSVRPFVPIQQTN